MSVLSEDRGRKWAHFTRLISALTVTGTEYIQLMRIIGYL